MTIVKILRISFLFICFCAVGLVIYVNFFASPRLPQSIYSPDNSKIIVPTINNSKSDMTKYLCVKITAVDAQTSQVLFEEQTGASDRMNWSIQWLTNHLILLKSSDIGSYCWQEDKNNVWQSTTCPKKNETPE